MQEDGDLANKATLVVSPRQQLNDVVEIKKALVRDDVATFTRPTAADAKNILGSTKVAVLRSQLLLRYSEETLHDCAQQNKQPEHDWRLVEIAGLSFCQLIMLCPGLFEFTDQKLIGLSKDRSWFDLRLDKDFYLLDFSGKFGLLDWHSQQKAIDKNAQALGRCPDQVFCEALFNIFSSSGEKMASTWSHWGVMRTGRRTFIEIGPFGPKGIIISDSWWYNALARRQVSLMRKFEV